MKRFFLPALLSSILFTLFSFAAFADGTVFVTLDASVLGAGTLGTAEVAVEDGDAAAKAVLSALDRMGYSAFYSGTPESGFYLAYIASGDCAGTYQGYTGAPSSSPRALSISVNIPGYIADFAKSRCDYFEENDFAENFAPYLGEFCFTNLSGWVYSLNGVHASRAMSDVAVTDGDAIRVSFTLVLGDDLTLSPNEETTAAAAISPPTEPPTETTAAPPVTEAASAEVTALPPETSSAVPAADTPTEAPTAPETEAPTAPPTETTTGKAREEPETSRPTRWIALGALVLAALAGLAVFGLYKRKK